jgi:putative ABC transport system permease protein
MNLFECLRVAMRALVSNPLRTALTMLGIIIGVGVVIVVVAIGEGATKRVTDAVNSLGTNLLTIRSGSAHLRINAVIAKASSNPTSSTATSAPSTLGPANHMTLDDARLIGENFPEAVEAVAPLARADDLPVRLGDAHTTSDIFGVTPDYVYVNNAPAVRGRFFNNAEVEGSLKVCLVGATIVEKLTGSMDTDLVGRNIEVHNQNFLVIGLLKPKGAGAFGQDQDDQIVMPITTAMDRILNQRYINSISVRCTSQEMMPLAQQQISMLLRNRHKVPPPYPDNDDFNIRNQSELMERQRSVTDTMTSLLSTVAIVSLVVGGIGIMNIMLVSVTERTREIGIRKAVGATPRDILFQFLIESAIISLLGGLLGIVLGIGTAIMLADLGGWTTLVDVNAVLVALGVSGGIGLFFGIYPATQAAALHPIDALRFE